MTYYVVQKFCPSSLRWIDQDYYGQEELGKAIVVCRRIAQVDGCTAQVREIGSGNTVFSISPSA